MPLDDQRILSESRKNSDMHPDDWFRNEEGDYEYPPLERLTDCLIVVVPEDKYHLLREVKIDYAEGMFEIRR